MPKKFTDPEAIAEDIIRDVGTNLVVGLPLGLGKANHVVNALYARAAADRAISLTLFSALTLEKPNPGNVLERRFIARGCAAAQHQGDRVFLPRGQMAARAVRPAALHFRQLHPCRVISARPRSERRHATGREARGRRGYAL